MAGKTVSVLAVLATTLVFCLRKSAYPLTLTTGTVVSLMKDTRTICPSENGEASPIVNFVPPVKGSGVKAVILLPLVGVGQFQSFSLTISTQESTLHPTIIVLCPAPRTVILSLLSGTRKPDVVLYVPAGMYT